MVTRGCCTFCVKPPYALEYLQINDAMFRTNYMVISSNVKIPGSLLLHAATVRADKSATMELGLLLET